MTVTVERATEDELSLVIRELDPEIEDYYLRTYGTADSAGKGSPELFTEPRGGLVIARYGNETAGIAGWTDIERLGYGIDPYRPLPNTLGPTCELKRLYVRERYRGKGLAGLLDECRMAEIFLHTRFENAVGETGAEQLGSRAIHSKPPYTLIEPFGDFAQEAHLGSMYYAVNRTDWENYEKETERG